MTEVNPTLPLPPRVVVVGVGNPDRGDDAVGLMVARCLQRQAPHEVTVLTHNGDATTLLEVWQHAEAVVLVDAVSSGAVPGTIHRIEAHDRAIERAFLHSSTHTFGVAEAIELARALGQLPAYLVVYGIEGQTFEVGSDLSTEVSQAISEVVSRVCQDLSALSP